MSTKSGTLTIIGLGIVSWKVKSPSYRISLQLIYITGIVFASLRLEEGAKGWVDDQVSTRIATTKSNWHNGGHHNPQIEIPKECKPAEGSASAGEDADAWWCKAIVDMQDGEDIDINVMIFDLCSISIQYCKHTIQFSDIVCNADILGDIHDDLVNYPFMQFCKAIGNMKQHEKDKWANGIDMGGVYREWDRGREWDCVSVWFIFLFAQFAF